MWTIEATESNRTFLWAYKSVIVSIYFYQNAVLISIKHQNFQVEVFEKLHAELMFLMIKYLSFLMKKGFRKKGPSHLMIMYFD